jgi:gamma-butyrobetaine dioxygenase
VSESLRRAGILAVEAHDDRLQVTWQSGTLSTFHYLWLRDNCPCPECRHPSVPERLVDTTSIPPDVAPASVEVTSDGGLVVAWDGGSHHSVYDPAWLAEHVYDHGPRYEADGREMWTAGEAPAVGEVAYDRVMGSDGELLTWLQRLERVGVGFVRDAPTEPGTVTGIAERVAFLRNSNFGLLWDVVSKPNPDSIAYTSGGLSPHIDLVAREMLPGVQFLHCLVCDASGGDSVLVDGFACAAELAATDPESYHRLTATPLLWRYRDGGGTDISAREPVIRLGLDGAPFAVRYSNALLAPLEVPPERTLETYRAVRAFVRLIRSGRFELRFRLRPGDVMCFDNYRILHGRTAFDPNSGHRHLQGCYVDRDDFLSRIRTLQATVPRG